MERQEVKQEAVPANTASQQFPPPAPPPASSAEATDKPSVKEEAGAVAVRENGESDATPPEGEENPSNEQFSGAPAPLPPPIIIVAPSFSGPVFPSGGNCRETKTVFRMPATSIKEELDIVGGGEQIEYRLKVNSSKRYVLCDVQGTAVCSFLQLSLPFRKAALICVGENANILNLVARVRRIQKDSLLQAQVFFRRNMSRSPDICTNGSIHDAEFTIEASNGLVMARVTRLVENDTKFFSVEVTEGVDCSFVLALMVVLQSQLMGATEGAVMQREDRQSDAEEAIDDVEYDDKDDPETDENVQTAV